MVDIVDNLVGRADHPSVVALVETLHCSPNLHGDLLGMIVYVALLRRVRAIAARIRRDARHGTWSPHCHGEWPVACDHGR